MGITTFPDGGNTEIVEVCNLAKLVNKNRAKILADGLTRRNMVLTLQRLSLPSLMSNSI